jgi:hypothetical protein
MRNKVFVRVLNKKNNWLANIKIRMAVEIHVIKCLGILKYIKKKLCNK